MGPSSSGESIGSTLRNEKKFVFAAARQDIAASWLDHHCAADDSFRHNLISSLYFDTPDTTFLDRKTDSDLLKWKVRVRWYAEPDGTGFSDAGYLEVKSKDGAAGRKTRLRLAASGADLDRNPFGIGAELPIEDLLDAHPWPTGSPLLPMCVIRYRRRRYVDAASGIRLALDTEIEADQVNEDLCLRPMVRPLDQAVLEIKGHGAEHLPTALRGMQPATGMRRDAFSKYGECMKYIAT